MKKGRLIAVTGGIGSGKSSACVYLREKGYTVLDADAISRALSEEKAFLRRIADCFGERFIENGGLNRKALANYCFSDEERTRKLNSLFHGAVYERIFLLADRAFEDGESVCFAEIPLLFESGREKDFDEVWIITAPESVRVERVMKRSGLTAEEVRLRIAAQFDYSKACGVLIDNSSGEAELRERIDKLLQGE